MSIERILCIVDGEALGVAMVTQPNGSITCIGACDGILYVVHPKGGPERQQSPYEIAANEIVLLTDHIPTLTSNEIIRWLADLALWDRVPWRKEIATMLEMELRNRAMVAA